MLENFKGPNILCYFTCKDLRILIIGQKEESPTDITPILDHFKELSPNLYLDIDIVSYIKDQKVIGPKFIEQTYKQAVEKKYPVHACSFQASAEVDYILYKEIKRSTLKNILKPSVCPVYHYNNLMTGTEFSEIYTIARITKNTQEKIKCAVVYGSSTFALRLSRRLSCLGFTEILEYSQRNESNSIRAKEVLCDIF